MINLEQDNNKDLAERIVTRMMNQGQEEIIHVLSKLFPNSKVMRIRSTAVDFANKNESGVGEFLGLFETDEVDNNIFNILSGANTAPALLKARGSFDPTKFSLTITCKRTPFKEFFDECQNEVCEQCIERRVSLFVTENPLSKAPFIAKVERVEQRRLDLCKNCGQMFTKKDEINLQNERLLYKCSYCGHKGWTKAR